MIRAMSSRRKPKTAPAPRPSVAAPGAARFLAPAAVALAILFCAAVRIRLADVPLERDEGEYAYAGQLLLQGVPPYQLAYNMKFPGTYYAYAAILASFGASPRGVHLGLLVVNAATTLLVYLLGKRLLGTLPGVFSAWAFALLSLDRWILGVFAHATHFVILPVVASLVLLVRDLGSERRGAFFASGVLLGLAVLMKQHAALFLPLGLGLVAWGALRGADGSPIAAIRRVAWVASGAVAPFAALVVLFLAQGVLGQFWFWTFQYAREYVTRLPLSSSPGRFLAGLAVVSAANPAIWLAGAVGLVALWTRGWSSEARVVLTALLVSSLLATVPGFYFRPHYFIVMLPAVALLVGVAAGSAERLLRTIVSNGTAAGLVVAGGVALAAMYVLSESAYLFSWTPRTLSRMCYGANPFVESEEIARYIRERTGPDDRIAILGSEPQIYFYAQRRSATGYIYAYPLMEPQEFASTMQDEMMRQIEEAHPAYVVFAQVGSSWLAGPDSDMGLLQWAQRYMSACYDVVGVADIRSLDETTYAWDGAATSYRPRSQNVVYTFRRRSDAPCVARPPPEVREGGRSPP